MIEVKEVRRGEPLSAKGHGAARDAESPRSLDQLRFPPASGASLATEGPRSSEHALASPVPGAELQPASAVFRRSDQERRESPLDSRALPLIEALNAIHAETVSPIRARLQRVAAALGISEPPPSPLDPASFVCAVEDRDAARLFRSATLTEPELHVTLTCALSAAACERLAEVAAHDAPTTSLLRMVRFEQQRAQERAVFEPPSVARYSAWVPQSVAEQISRLSSEQAEAVGALALTLLGRGR